MRAMLEKSASLLLLLTWWMAPYAAGQNRGDSQASDRVTRASRQATNRDDSHVDDIWQDNQDPSKPRKGRSPSDIKCSIVEWNNSSPKPALTVVCPPPEIFAPLRVILKFSWVDSKDVPREAAKVVAEPRNATRIQLGKGNVRAFLKVSDHSDTTKEKWVVFNSLQSFRLVPMPE